MASEFNIKNGFISNSNSRVLGTLTATTLNIQTLGGGTSINNLGIDSSGNVVTGTAGGGSTFTGGTINGATNFTAGLTANTISATTYFNLPTDIRVTGGTYSSGTAVFTNNTGGTFSVTGFSTSTATPFTGGTVTGATIFTNGLTANTISATTYYNLPISIVNTTSLFSTGLVNTGLNASSVDSSIFLGDNAGKDATGASYSIFLGGSAGQNATNATSSIFMGIGAGNLATDSYFSNFIGQQSGQGATNANQSNFLGYNAGYGATGASNSNFVGRQTGENAINASNSNFIGYGAGDAATNASYSNFLGSNAGKGATNATYSNFLGSFAGDGATNASYSNLFGFQVGQEFTGNNIGENNIIIGTNISLPSGATNSINVGGVLFGVNTYSTTSGDPSIVANPIGKIGINVITPTEALHVSGNTLIDGDLTATTISATTYLNLPTDTLQEVYTASTAPRITTNNTLGSFRIRGGTGSDSDNNFIIENNTGDVTSYWNANGDLVLQTISATTYYNLPLDVYVTGGSYNQISGIATFTNNSGGTFTVDGFSTGSDEFFTGGTVTGPSNFLNGLTANTISATTYYNLPTDVFVTGGTYSNGSTTFTNITGGTFDVTGYYTGSTDVYVTGGTYTEGITTFTNNTGGTFNVASSTSYSAGVISGSTGWSSTGTGQINLPSVKVALYNNDYNIEPILIYDMTSGTTGSGGISPLINNDTNYVVIEYNGGSPIFNVYDNDSVINDSSVVLFMVIYRAGNFIHTLEFGNQGAGLANKLNDRFIMTDRFGYESGLALGLSGSTGIVTLTAGVAWNGPNRQSLASLNSQDDIFFKNFHSGGTWVYTTTGNTINNTYYDNGTDIVVATVGKYLTNWYFRGQEINDHIYEVYSTNEYDSVALAQLSTEPSLPELITSHGILLGRIILQVSSTTGLTESAFVNVFQSTNVTSHNDLSGIQGGSAGQYYHLNANQYNNIALTNVDNNFSVGQTFNTGITANTISVTTVTGDSGLFVSMSATTISGGTLYGDGSNITNIPVPYGIINAIANFNFLT